MGGEKKAKEERGGERTDGREQSVSSRGTVPFMPAHPALIFSSAPVAKDMRSEERG